MAYKREKQSKVLKLQIVPLQIVIKTYKILQLSDKARVDASVKLKFKDIRGRSCVVTRRMMQSKGAKVNYYVSCTKLHCFLNFFLQSMFYLSF